MSDQAWLLPYQNPLKTRLGDAFFKAIPKNPGVYSMFGEAGELLYVGKAKNLKTRLASYKLARPGQVSRKVIRLLNKAREIRWEVCESEKDALLLENRMLRDLRPPFNRVNTRPETYLFIGMRFLAFEKTPQLRLRLTMNPKKQGDLLFGAYKNRGRVQDGYRALLRLLFAVHEPPERFAYPTRLTGARCPMISTSPFPADWVLPLRRFLSGIDEELLVLITQRLIEKDELPRFIYHVIQEDLVIAQEFFNICSRRNRELRKNHGLRTRLIRQDQVDDLGVLELARLGKI
jgi:hypothetical protein